MTKRFGSPAAFSTDVVLDHELASALQAVLNDLKRDHATAASELDLPHTVIRDALAGDPYSAASVRQRAVERWPVAMRDLQLLEDDVPDNVCIYDAEKSRASGRIIVRGEGPYYEYRDTAMARLSPIRPEWIRMMVQTDECDPLESSLCWNRGHSLHQLTFFLGDVDFFYEIDGDRLGCRMSRGDSALIPSWVPHTFSAVLGGMEPVILAVTFPGRLRGDTLEELRILGEHLRPRDLPDGTSAATMFAGLLAIRIAEASLTLESVSRDADMEPTRMEALAQGAEEPTAAELERIAKVLRVFPRDLAGAGGHRNSVIIESAGLRPFDNWPDQASPAYRVRQLAASPLTPDGRGLEIEVLKTDIDGPARLRFGLHQYGYVVGDKPIMLTWGATMSSSAVLRPGDSFYMKPWIDHAFTVAEASSSSRSQLVCFRSAGALGKDAQLELSLLGHRGTERYLNLQAQWYD